MALTLCFKLTVFYINISIAEADCTAVTVGYRNCRKKTTHANSKTPLRQLRNIVQYVIACMMKVHMHHANATKC